MVVLEKVRWIRRAIYPNGDGGVAIGVPAPVVNELDLEPGETEVDLEYDRDNHTLCVHFPAPDDDDR